MIELKERDIFSKDKDIENLNERELLELAKEGNTKAISILINKYKPLIFKISSKYFISAFDKEDIIQEGLIGLYKAIRDYNPDKKINFRSFIYYVIKKRIYSLLRDSNRQKRLIKEVVELKENLKIIIEDNKEERIGNREIIEKVKNKLSNLERSILKLYLNNLSYKEIEENLKITKKQIDNTLKRIKEKIKEVVSDV